MINQEQIRKNSLMIAVQLGYDVNATLPLLDKEITLRGKNEVIKRALALHCVVACSYGFDPKKALSWLIREHLLEHVTKDEKILLEQSHSSVDRTSFQTRVEGLWALAWSLKLIAKLDFARSCGNELVTIFPDLKKEEDSKTFMLKGEIRTLEEIASACDLAYCLHWSLRQAQHEEKPVPGKAAPHVIIERRRALEWLISSEPWDEVSLDT